MPRTSPSSQEAAAAPEARSVPRRTRTARTAEENKRLQHMGAKLRQAREIAGLTQLEVARAVHKSDRWVSDLERGVLEISPLMLAPIAGVLGYPIAYFVDPDFNPNDAVRKPRTRFDWNAAYPDDPLRAKIHYEVDQAFERGEPESR